MPKPNKPQPQMIDTRNMDYGITKMEEEEKFQTTSDQDHQLYFIRNQSRESSIVGAGLVKNERGSNELEYLPKPPTSKLTSPMVSGLNSPNYSHSENLSIDLSH